MTGLFAVGMVWCSTFSVSAAVIPGDFIMTDDFCIVESDVVNIKDGTKPYKEYAVPKTNVKDALEYVGISLGDNDVINVSLNTSIKSDMSIKISRVSYKQVTRTYKTKYKIKKKTTSALCVGQRKIKHKGKKGSKKVTFTKNTLMVS